MSALSFDLTGPYSLFSDRVNNASSDIKKQQDALLIDQLKKYLPGVTLQNVEQYAHRLSCVTERSMNGSTRLYLDLGTPDQVLLMELTPIISQATQKNGHTTITATQTFKLF